MYLTRDANMAALGSVAKCCAPGSLLVFSYVDQGVFEPEEDIEDIQFLERYDPSGANGLESSGIGHIARVRVFARLLRFTPGARPPNDLMFLWFAVRWPQAGPNRRRRVGFQTIERLRRRKICPLLLPS